MEKGTLIGLCVAVAGVFGSAVLHGINVVVPLHGDRFDPHRLLGLHRRHDDLVPDGSDLERHEVRPEGHEGQRGDVGDGDDQRDRQADQPGPFRGPPRLEDEAKWIEDPFFRKGIEFAVDGTDPEALKKTLVSEIVAMKDRHKVGQGWFTQAGVFAPTFGIIGAVFGLMATMAHLNAPAEVGHGIAGAFVATFWGVFLANALFLPMANKLKQLSTIEVAHKMLIVEGIMAIQAGVSPRVVEELLKSHVPPGEREEVVVPPAASEAPAEAEAA